MLSFTEDTLIFITSLLVCIPVATFYKQIEDVEKKRNIGAVIGMVISLVTCGQYIYYTIILVLVNVITLKSCDKRVVHQVSLGFTWLFLLYMHTYVKCSKYATWLFQILALRLVGLAFEMNMCDKTTTDDKRPAGSGDSVMRLSASDIFCYAYFFIGLHKGPYYTWKTFNDHLNSRINLLSDFRMVTEQKLKKAFLFTLGYFLLRSKYPLSMYEKDEFYVNYGTDYRFLSCVPLLVMHVVEQQIIMMLSTSAFTEAGLGVYPVRCLAVPGAGPTVHVKLTGDDLPENEYYNFSMLRCYDNEKLLLGPKMNDTMRGWDMATRYWFSQYVTKNLIKSNFEVRSACSFLLWTIWVGPSLQKTIISLTLWVYMNLESEYAQLCAEMLKGPWDIGFAIMRMFCLFYLTPCFTIDNTSIALRYYNSIYWMYHIVLAVLIVVAIGLHRNRYGPPIGLSTHNMFSKPDSMTQTFVKAKKSTSTKPSAEVSAISGGQNKESVAGSTQKKPGNTDQNSPSTSGYTPDQPGSNK